MDRTAHSHAHPAYNLKCVPGSCGPLLKPGMLILPCRAFDANTFLAEVHTTRTIMLTLPAPQSWVTAHLPDGSYLWLWTG